MGSCWIRIALHCGMPANDPPLKSGVHGDYQWLVADCALDELVRLCPAVVLGRFLAVISRDSGPLHLSEEELALGWESRLGIAYSPKISQIDGLPYDVGYEEWYVLDEPRDIGPMLAKKKSPFERAKDSRELFTYVNCHMGPSDKDEVVLEMFWRDVCRIAPLSYLSDNACQTTLVTADSDLFAAAHSALSAFVLSF
jgi:hypothetical protein